MGETYIHTNANNNNNNNKNMQISQFGCLFFLLLLLIFHHFLLVRSFVNKPIITTSKTKVEI